MNQMNRKGIAVYHKTKNGTFECRKINYIYKETLSDKYVRLENLNGKASFDNYYYD